MNKAEELLDLISENVLKGIEKKFKMKLKPGRNVIGGFPVDIDDQDPDEGGISMTAVDAGAMKDLMKDFRKKGFKTKVISKTGNKFVVDQ